MAVSEVCDDREVSKCSCTHDSGVLLRAKYSRDTGFGEIKRCPNNVLVTPMPDVKSNMRRPVVVVTWEPEPEARTSGVRRPIPLATCLVPNLERVERVAMVPGCGGGDEVSRGMRGEGLSDEVKAFASTC